MQNVVTIEGRTLEKLLDLLGAEHMNGRTYRLRLADDHGELLVKVNEDMWSAPLGPTGLASATPLSQPVRCWCDQPARYVNPATDATPQLAVCGDHTTDGFDHLAPSPDEPAPTRPGHTLRPPVRLREGEWSVRCSCGLAARASTLAAATQAGVHHTLHADTMAGV